MTLNFNILAANNVDWGFDAFSMAADEHAMPAMLGSATMQPQPQLDALSVSAHSISGHLASAGEGAENVSPMKNDALGVPPLASDLEACTFDSNLYVASLPSWFTDADLHDLFQRFGPILSTKAMCHRGTTICRGYGFVLFQHAEDAAVARSEMIGHVVGSNKIQVRRARYPASAALGDAPSTLGEAQHTSSLNVSPHFAPTPTRPPSYAYSRTPLQAAMGGSDAGRSTGPRPSPTPKQMMLVPIPNGSSIVHGPGNVVYVMVTLPQPQTSNIV